VPRSLQGPSRHRRGEPLRASWDPVVARPPSRPDTGRPDTGRPGPVTDRRPPVPPPYARRRVVAVLAVALVVLTGFVVVRLSTEAPAEPGEASAPGAVGSTQAPIVGEAAPGESGVDIPTAVLPDGGAYPVTGAGTWHVVPGTTPQVGQGRVFTYSVEVEDGTTFAEGDSAFATAVDATLDDPRSWVGSGQIALRRVDTGVPDFRISLTSQASTRSICGYDIKYEASCWDTDRGRVVINGARWVRGAGAFEGQLGLYRQYAINHEVGHVFRNPHVPCAVAGDLAPVMMQQSFGVSDDYLAALTERNPQGLQIPRDGKVCRANAWPYPRR